MGDIGGFEEVNVAFTERGLRGPRAMMFFVALLSVAEGSLLCLRLSLEKWDAVAEFLDAFD